MDWETPKSDINLPAAAARQFGGAVALEAAEASSQMEPAWLARGVDQCRVGPAGQIERCSQLLPPAWLFPGRIRRLIAKLPAPYSGLP